MSRTKISKSERDASRASQRVPPSVRAALCEPGRPLDPSAQVHLESRLGHDFGQVRVHTGAQAAASAEALDSLAYTIGEEIVFGEEQYRPDTAEGLSLLAHELTHVVQQDAASGSPGEAHEQDHAP